MKRSARVRLLLLGGASSALVAGCGPGTGQPPPISAENVYTNDFYVAGVGYYHAPFHDWYLLPYNHFNPQNQHYFYGGQWGTAPFQSIVNVSSPTPEVAQRAEAQRTDVVRGGFGGTAHSFLIGS